MVKMTTPDIQSIGLELMRDIHSFCNKNDINYSLAYGTMLGAVRHNGFIPWDDDVDIMMPRPDYEKFLTTYKSDSYYLKSAHDKDCYTNFSRLYEVKKTVTSQDAQPCNREVGVFVDIFPIDGVFDDPVRRQKHYEKVIKVAKDRLNIRFLRTELKRGSFMKRLRTLASIMKIHVLNGGNMSRMYKKLDMMSQAVHYGSSKYCSYYCCNDAMKKGKQELFPTEAFQSFQLCQFETEQFYISTYYDQMLTVMYGDYMKLPPVEDRRAKHGFVDFYWKENKDN